MYVDRVSQIELIKNIAGMGAVGCLLQKLSDSMRDCSQIKRIGTSTTIKKNITNGVPQGSILGLLLYCIFINKLPGALEFSELFVFINDLKILAVNRTRFKIQTDPTALNRCATEIKTSFAIRKCAKLQPSGKDRNFLFANSISSSVKKIRVIVTSDLTWNSRLENDSKSKQIFVFSETKCLT